jgi:hypothetical protein
MRYLTKERESEKIEGVGERRLSRRGFNYLIIASVVFLVAYEGLIFYCNRHYSGLEKKADEKIEQSIRYYETDLRDYGTIWTRD